MSNNGITEVGASAFCENFSECYVRVLFMHWNPLGPGGGAAFARALQVNRDIQILDLSFCNMGSARDLEQGRILPQLKLKERDRPNGGIPLSNAEKEEKRIKEKADEVYNQKILDRHDRLPPRKKAYHIDLTPAE